jgi:hypothetical protein
MPKATTTATTMTTTTITHTGTTTTMPTLTPPPRPLRAPPAVAVVGSTPTDATRKLAPAGARKFTAPVFADTMHPREE